MDLTLGINGGEMKVSWRPEEASDLLYTVLAGEIDIECQRIRASLNDLNRYALETSFSEERDPDWVRYNTILANLKRHGRELYLRLLQETVSGSDYAQLLESQIRALGPDDTLNVHCSGEGVTLPLGFVCDPDLQEPGDAGMHAPSRADFNNLWINRFDITWLLEGCYCVQDQRIDREKFRALYALHPAELDKALAQLHEEPTGGYADKFNDLMELQVGKYGEWDKVQKACKSIADCNTVVFVFAHAEGGDTLHLGTGAKAVIGCSEFKKFLRDSRQADKSKLVILNCCASVSGQESGSLLRAVTHPGFCGLVGTEAEILNAAALRCGIHLMWEMCFQGRSLGDAFKSMQQAPDLFPQNLFYSCYARRKFQLDQPLARRSNNEQERIASMPVAGASVPCP